jgi:hypothetical protein
MPGAGLAPSFVKARNARDGSDSSTEIVWLNEVVAAIAQRLSPYT